MSRYDLVDRILELLQDDCGWDELRDACFHIALSAALYNRSGWAEELSKYGAVSRMHHSSWQ